MKALTAILCGPIQRKYLAGQFPLGGRDICSGPELLVR